MPLMAVPEVYKEGKDGGRNVYDGYKKSQVYTLSNLLCLTTDQQWEQGLWQGCKPVHTFPGFASHSHHFQGRFTTQEGKELKVSSFLFFFFYQNHRHNFQCSPISANIDSPLLTLPNMSFRIYCPIEKKRSPKQN